MATRAASVKVKSKKPAKKRVQVHTPREITPLLKSTKYNTPGMVTESNNKRGNPWAKGNPGKPVGRNASMKYRVKEALLEAAERSGKDGNGQDGMIGYFVWLSRTEPGVFGRMLEKVMPTQHELNDRRTKLTPAEAAERLRSRGIPVPPLLLEMEAVSSVTREKTQNNETDTPNTDRFGDPLGETTVINVNTDGAEDGDNGDNYEWEEDSNDDDE